MLKMIVAALLARASITAVLLAMKGKSVGLVTGHFAHMREFLRRDQKENGAVSFVGFCQDTDLALRNLYGVSSGQVGVFMTEIMRAKEAGKTPETYAIEIGQAKGLKPVARQS